MSTEIERKFLLKGTAWKEGATGTFVRQGYLSTDQERTVRVRTIGEEGFLTIKGITRGVSRLEFEYAIPMADANRMFDELCPHPLIEKIRYRIPYGDLVWEVDEFRGENEGLVVAEVELSHEDQEITIPEWIGEEVSGDARYRNSNLSVYPYTEW
jgi:CYTH domain-containing protein